MDFIDKTSQIIRIVTSNKKFWMIFPEDHLDGIEDSQVKGLPP